MFEPWPTSQADVVDPGLPDLVRVLGELQLLMVSVNWNRSTNDLRVFPVVDVDHLRDQVRENFDSLRFLLPGYCDGCGEWSIKRYEMYWAAHPHLCPRCYIIVLQQLESGRVDWPEIALPDML